MRRVGRVLVPGDGRTGGRAVRSARREALPDRRPAHHRPHVARRRRTNVTARPRSVHLGFEVGSGEAVSIPLQHLVATGQTQRAGKTTTLEALIARSNVKAIAFVTKRGEGAFRDAREIQPYFREQADWKFVASILEASRGEKLKFERSWIIRASK